jgi:hypothetical protein
MATGVSRRARERPERDLHPPGSRPVRLLQRHRAGPTRGPRLRRVLRRERLRSPTRRVRADDRGAAGRAVCQDRRRSPAGERAEGRPRDGSTPPASVPPIGAGRWRLPVPATARRPSRPSSCSAVPRCPWVTTAIVISLVAPTIVLLPGGLIERVLRTGTLWAPAFANPELRGAGRSSWALMVVVISSLVAVPSGSSPPSTSPSTPRRVRRVVKPALEVLEGIPTVAIGLFAFWFIRPLAETFSRSSWQGPFSIGVAGLGRRPAHRPAGRVGVR